MRGWMALGLLAVLAGCGKTKDGHVDNAATRYTAGLQQNVGKAHVAADKANAAIAQTQAGIDAANAANQ